MFLYLNILFPVKLVLRFFGGKLMLFSELDRTIFGGDWHDGLKCFIQQWSFLVYTVLKLRPGLQIKCTIPVETQNFCIMPILPIESSYQMVNVYWQKILPWFWTKIKERSIVRTLNCVLHFTILASACSNFIQHFK